MSANAPATTGSTPPSEHFTSTVTDFYPIRRRPTGSYERSAGPILRETRGRSSGPLLKKGVSVNFQLEARRVAGWTGPLALLAGSLFLPGCSTGPSTSTDAPCMTTDGSGLPRLTQVTGSPSTTLPPSHDNDAGGAHIPDVHPDADTDANQRPPHPNQGCANTGVKR